MKYIKRLNIKRFKGIKDLELLDLGAINILAGENNAGKTSILEAIEIIENPFEEGSIIYVGRKREILNNQSSSYTIFKNMLSKSSNTIEIEGTIKDKEFTFSIEGKQVSIISEKPYSPIIEGFEGKVKVDFGEISYEEDVRILQTDTDFVVDNNLNILPIVHITPISHLLDNSSNEVIKKGKKKELISLLSIFDKDIVGLEMIEENKKTVAYIEHRRLGIMPLSTYGDGLKKVLLIGSSIIKAEKGVLLIDEIETALHYSAMEEVFKWIIEAANSYKVQIFATTYNSEALDALLESAMEFKGEKYLEESINIITLKKGDEHYQTKVRVLDGLKAYKFREDFNMELRG